MSDTGGGQPVTRKGRKRWTVWFGKEDFSNAEAVRKANGHDNVAAAVRFAVAEQASRDRAARKRGKR